MRTTRLASTSARLTATALALTIAATLSGTATAAGQPPALVATLPIAPGLVREILSWQTQGGPQQLQVLRFDRNDPRVTMRAELAGGRIAGKAPVHQILRSQDATAVAAVNGTFWLGNPSGDPEGLMVRDGRYISEPATQGAGPRGAFGLMRDGSYKVGRPGYQGTVWLPSGKAPSLGGIDRGPGKDEVIAFTDAWGPTTNLPAGSAVVTFDDLDLGVQTLQTAQVTAVSTAGDVPIPPRGTALVATGTWIPELSRLRPGDKVTFDVRISDDWRDAVQAVAAGPLIVQNGKMTNSVDWETEGFANNVHNNQAAPRTLVVFTADDQMLFVTIDGRMSDARGLTTGEAAELALELGAVDAVMMDGGGSTTMSVDGRIENRPCCDAPGYRAVSNALVLRSTVTTPDVRRLAGDSRFTTAAEAAFAGWPDGSPQVLIASGRSFPDGLAGGVLAASRNAPLLLTEPTTLPGATLDALRRLGTARVTILGGPGAVSEDVATALTAAGFAVDRIAGGSRAGTAAEVARRLPTRPTLAIIASDGGFADALSATVPASRTGATVLLSSRDALSPETAQVLTDLGIREVVVAGGPGAISETVEQDLIGRGLGVSRVSGVDRFRTSAALVRWAEKRTGTEFTKVAIAAGVDFPDALAGGPLGARLGAPVLLTATQSIASSPGVREWIADHDLSQALVLGGRVVVATWVTHELQAAVGAP